MSSQHEKFRLIMANGQSMDYFKVCVLIPKEDLSVGTTDIRFVCQHQDTIKYIHSLRCWCCYFDKDIPGTVFGFELDRRLLACNTQKGLQRVNYYDRFEIVNQPPGSGRLDAKHISVWHLVKNKMAWLNERESYISATPLFNVKTTEAIISEKDRIINETHEKIKRILQRGSGLGGIGFQQIEKALDEKKFQVPPEVDDLIIIDPSSDGDKAISGKEKCNEKHILSPKILLVNGWYPPSKHNLTTGQYRADLELDVGSVQTLPHALTVLSEHVNVIRNDKMLYWIWSQIIKCDQTTQIIRDTWSLYMAKLLNVKDILYSTAMFNENDIGHLALFKASCPDVLGPCAIACLIKWRLCEPLRLAKNEYAIGTALLVERAWHLHNKIGNRSVAIPHEYYEDDLFLVIQFSMSPDDTMPAFRLSKSCNGEIPEFTFHLSLHNGDFIFYPKKNTPVIIPGHLTDWMNQRIWSADFKESVERVMQILGYKR